VKKSLFQKPFSHLIIIIILGLIAYSNTFHVPFLFDDYDVIVNNPIVKDLHFFSNPSEAEVFTDHFGYHTFRSRYIGYLTFALNYKIHGLDVTGYHIVNLFIHLITALLIYSLVILTFRTPFINESKLSEYSSDIALFAALLFTCHPLQTGAVTFIWQRVSSLAAMFYVLCLVTYIRWRLHLYQKELLGFLSFQTLKLFPFYLLSLISAVLAMKTKQTAFTLPVMLLLYEFMFFSGKKLRRLLYLIPLLLTIPIIPITLIDVDQPIGDLIGDVSKATRDLTDISRADYLLTQFRVIVTYIRLIFLPINQNFDYDYPVYDNFFNPNVFLSFSFLLSVFCAGVYLLSNFRHSHSHVRLVSFGIFWFFITLLVESSVIPIKQLIYEHRAYLPSIGIFVGSSTLVSMGITHFKSINRTAGWASVFMLSIVVIVLVGATYARNSIWKDEISLWSDVIKKSPNKAGGYYSLGLAYQEMGLIDKSNKNYNIALKLNPNYADAYINLGVNYMSEGYIEKAIEAIKAAIKLNPYIPYAHLNLGIAYDKKGLIDIAIEQYQTALRLKPDFAEAYYNLGLAYVNKGLIDKAIQHFQFALNLTPNDADTHYYLAVAYRMKGLANEAEKHFDIARDLKPSLFYTGTHKH
jgi:Tfp pilus assembly protein PilF